ncbi:hypothetical protein K435DRAFT_611227, partial [Dendrothele bispora CBS 962.96]
DPVIPPRHACPLTESELNVFRETLQGALDENRLPPGYGILPDEWHDEQYPTVEVICTGRKGGKELSVWLPDFIWRPWAKLWVLGLFILDCIL